MAAKLSAERTEPSFDSSLATLLPFDRDRCVAGTKICDPGDRPREVVGRGIRAGRRAAIQREFKVSHSAVEIGQSPFTPMAHSPYDGAEVTEAVSSGRAPEGAPTCADGSPIDGESVLQSDVDDDRATRRGSMRMQDLEWELLFPRSDSADPAVAITSEKRKCVFGDEILHFYLLVRHSSATSIKIGSDPMADMAAGHIDIQVSASILGASASGDLQPAPIHAPPWNSSSSSSAPHSHLQQPIATPSATYLPARARTMSHAGVVAPAAVPHDSPPFHRRSTSLKPPPSATMGMVGGRPSVEIDVEAHGRALAPMESLTQSASRGPVEDVIFSYAYSPHVPEQGVVKGEGCCLFPLRLPIVTVQPLIPPTADRYPTAIFCDPVDFDSQNLFQGLTEGSVLFFTLYKEIIPDRYYKDPHFNPENFPTHRLPYQYKRQSTLPSLPMPTVLRSSLPIISPLDLRPRLISTSTSLMLSLVMSNSLQADTELNLESVACEFGGFSAASLGEVTYPLPLQASESVGVIFNLEPTEDLGRGGAAAAVFRRNLGGGGPITLHAIPQALVGHQADLCLCLRVQCSTNVSGTRGQTMSSRHHFRISTGGQRPNIRMETLELLPKSGIDPPSLAGIEISMKVITPAAERKSFAVQAFFVNRTNRTRHFSLSVPSTSQGAILMTESESLNSHHPHWEIREE
ncbi:hypothetical protein HK101_003079, partial [Irineochytrium annulatum]